MSVPFHLSLAEGRFGSLRLMFLSWWFKVGAVIFALITLFGIAGFVLGKGVSDGPRPQIVPFAIVAAMGIALYAAGRMLARHDRRGAILGLVLTLYPFLFAPFTNAQMDSVDIAVAAFTAILLVSVWPELTWRRTPATAAHPS